MAGESLIVFLIVGGVAGWLAGLIVKGGGFGLLGDIVVGVIGSVIGGWLFGRFGFGGGLLGAGLSATLGAVILLLILRFASRRRPL